MIYNKQFKSMKDVNAREAADLISMTNSFSCSNMYLRRISDPDYRQVNVMSILGVMSLNIKKGDELEIVCSHECDLTFLDNIIDWFIENN